MPEHPRIRFLRLPIETENGEAIFLIEIEGDILAGLGVSPDAVLGPVKGDEPYSLRMLQEIDVAAEAAVHSRRIGDQADLPSPDQIQPALQKHFDAEPDAARARRRLHLSSPAGKEKTGEKRNQTEKEER
jgi:hypothetical protein